MTANQRIALNFIATYGRSLYALVIGLLCGRWTLMALGEVDYGLMGLVGGLTVFVTFFNSLMATAVGRFYAFAVGEASVEGGEGVEICRKWFNTALLVHTVIPVLALLIGYPAGVWAVRHYLTIPVDRIDDCVWVWRFVCISVFLTMVSVPFNAMYNAKQYIAELTIYSFVTITLNAFFLHYMVNHPGSWLVRLSLWSCLLGVLPQLIITFRAVRLFPECRFRPQYLWNLRRLKALFVFAAYRFAGALSIMLKSQGLAIIVNKMLGPARNAAMTVASTVTGHSNTFAVSFLGALSPAITNAYGAGDLTRMRTLSYMACKLSTVMVLIFVLPLFVEVDEVLRLWLKSPPEGAAPVCACLLGALVFENLCCGHYLAIFADGRIRGYQLSSACSALVVLPVAFVLIWAGLDVVAVGWVMLIAGALMVAIRLYFGRLIAGLSVRHWMRKIFMPIFFAICCSLPMGCLVRGSMDPSFLRVVLSTLAVNGVLVPMIWFFVLGYDERQYVWDKIGSRFHLHRKGA